MPVGRDLGDRQAEGVGRGEEPPELVGKQHTPSRKDGDRLPDCGALARRVDFLSSRTHQWKQNAEPNEGSVAALCAVE